LNDYYKDLMDQPIPLLDDSTPRQASEDFLLRPKLVAWVKDLISNTDKSNLYEEESVNLDWMFDELGLHEIKVPPPPARPRPELPNQDFSDQDDYEDEDYFEDEVDIDELEVERYVEVINRFLGDLETRDGGLIQMKAAGCNLMEVLEEELEEDMSVNVRNLITFLVPAIWHALVPKNQIAQVDSEMLSTEIETLLFELREYHIVDKEATPQNLIELCFDEEMFVAMVQLIDVYQEEALKKDKLSDSETSQLTIHIIVVINVLSELL